MPVAPIGPEAPKVPKTIPLGIFEKITFQDAVDTQADIAAEHRAWKGRLEFMTTLWQPTRAAALERLVALHMGVDANRVRVSHVTKWRQGAFNNSMPVLIYDQATDALDHRIGRQAPEDVIGVGVRRVVLRCPIAANCATSADNMGPILEKMRVEVAMYVWMQRHCPEIRIPALYAFGLPNGLHYIHASRTSLFRRAWLRVRQLFASLSRRPVPSDYLPVAVRDCPISTGYMILEHFGPSIGTELPLVVRNRPLAEEPEKMKNMFRGISRIILALARFPQPRIGSFRFRDDGTIALENRPVASDMFLLESGGAPQVMPIDQTYTSVDQYVSDFIAVHDAAFLAAPNATYSAKHCRSDMAYRAFLRAVSHRFVDREYRNGPFALYMSDGNAANLMVDENWNITGMFDLEWVIAGPVDMLRVPHWLTWRTVDEIADKEQHAFSEARAAFMRAFREEELLMGTSIFKAAYGSTLSHIIDAAWDAKREWFYSSLLSVNGMRDILRSQIVPLYYPEKIAPELYRAWCPDADAAVEKKLHDRTAYLADLAALFGRDPPVMDADGNMVKSSYAHEDQDSGKAATDIAHAE